MLEAIRFQRDLNYIYTPALLLILGQICDDESKRHVEIRFEEDLFGVWTQT